MANLLDLEEIMLAIFPGIKVFLGNNTAYPYFLKCPGRCNRQPWPGCHSYLFDIALSQTEDVIWWE